MAAASKRPRGADSPPAVDGGGPTSARPDSRVLIDVGGTRFVSSKTTLAGASLYFRALMDRWDQHPEESIFLDADADAFQILLSCMRAGTAILPEHDAGLFARVLLLAEYLGMDALLAEIKARAYANMHPAAAKRKKHRDNAQCAALFDRETEGLQAAIATKLLPARFFEAVPEPPPPPSPAPERTIKAAIPAPPGYRAFFSDTYITSDTRDADDGEYMSVLSFVPVELRDGSHTMDAFVQELHNEAPFFPTDAEDTRSHVKLASAHAGANRHWIFVPPSTSSGLVAIPPGTVRGVWKKPGFTCSDEGKTVKIEGRHRDVTVDGESRGRFDWGDDCPPDGTEAVISSVRPWGVKPGHIFLPGNGAPVDRYVCTDGGTVLLENRASFKLPAVFGESMMVDLAFAKFDNDDNKDSSDSVLSTFYIPIASAQPSGQSETRHRLTDARTVTFGEKIFSHYTGASRS